jgi:alpha-L-rhamnosidase
VPVAAGLGNATEGAEALHALIVTIDAPGAPDARRWTAEIQTAVCEAWDTRVSGDGQKETTRAVHRAPADLDDIRRCLDKGKVAAADSAAIRSLLDRIATDLPKDSGLARRYTNNGVPDGWFELDLKVPAGQAFVIRAIETYNTEQLKTYDVLLDGKPALQRRFQRTAGGNGTVTYQFVVQSSEETADGKVRVRFQDVAGDFDPSIDSSSPTPISTAWISFSRRVTRHEPIAATRGCARYPARTRNANSRREIAQSELG